MVMSIVNDGGNEGNDADKIQRQGIVMVIYELDCQHVKMDATMFTQMMKLATSFAIFRCKRQE